jgi:hypothetical protein
MKSAFRLRFVALTALLVVTLAALSGSAQNEKRRGRKYKVPEPVARVEVTVLNNGNGKPLENASVIFHTLKDPGNMELKTNEDGKAIIDVLPIGEQIRLQIIAKGFQTYGGDYDLDKDQLALEIRMKRPGEQYSLYKAHPNDKTQKQEQSRPAEEPKK